MTIQRVNNEEQRGFRSQGRFQNVSYTNIQDVLFIRKTNVLSGHVGALERMLMCTRSQMVCLSAPNYPENPRCSDESDGQGNMGNAGKRGMSLIAPLRFERIGRDSKSSLCLIPPFKATFSYQGPPTQENTKTKLNIRT